MIIKNCIKLSLTVNRTQNLKLTVTIDIIQFKSN